MKPAVHITHGPVSAAVLQELYPEDHVIALADCLSEGPVVSIQDGQLWRQARSRFWKDFRWNVRDLPEVEDYQGVAQALEKFTETPRIFLWAGRCLDEQLALAWMVMLLRRLSIDLSQVSRVLVTKRTVSGKEVLTLSLLGSDDLRGQESTPSPFSESELRTIEEAWAALLSSDPSELMRFLARDSSVLPDLKSGMRFLMLRYPNIENGLNYIDKRLLELFGEDWLRAPQVVGEYLVKYHSQDLDLVGDLILFVRLLNMGRKNLRHPLVEIEGDVAAMRSTKIRLTDVGREVLSGKANHVELNGIDEWIGGVHLKAPPGPVWFYDNGALRLR